jgi:hypothetical protein
MVDTVPAALVDAAAAKEAEAQLGVSRGGVMSAAKAAAANAVAAEEVESMIAQKVGAAGAAAMAGASKAVAEPPAAVLGKQRQRY